MILPIEQLKQIVADVLVQAKHPVILCDFSDEAVLLVRLFPDIPIIVFPDLWEDDIPKQIIGELGLTAYFYKPVFAQKGVVYYNVAGKPMPILTDKVIRYSDTIPQYVWDLTIIPNTFPLDMFGDEVIAPLRNWSDEDIRQGLATQKHCLALAA